MQRNHNRVPNLKESTPAPTNWRGIGCAVAIIIGVLAAALFTQIADLLEMHRGSL